MTPMDLIKTIFLIAHLLVIVIMMSVIAFQSGKNSGLSALSGKSDTYLAKNRQKSRDARLALATKWVAGLFVVLTVVLNVL